MLTLEKKKELEQFAVEIRIKCMEQFAGIGIGHVGGSMSVCDLMACLYGWLLNVDPGNPKWEERDRFIMSKGHAGPALYSALALKGYFDTKELATLNQPNTSLPSHTDRNKTIGVDMTTGSLGQGFSAGLGIALACQKKGLKNNIYILLGDGECQEGQIWECALFAPAYKLTNVIVFVDFNNRQLDGTIDEVLALGDLSEKFEAFGWQTIDVADGHDIEQICSAADTAKSDKTRPSLIVLHTVKGRGCCFAENEAANHNMPVTKEMAEIAVRELELLKSNL